MSADIRKKGILLFASLLLLLAAGMYMAFAWYTKMTSASEMSFDAAHWEYSANFSTEPIELNIYNCPIKYSDGDEGVSVVQGKVAPGVSGYAPIVLSAGNSDVSVGYSLSVDKSLMSNEFKERIYFFQDADMTVPAGDSFGGDGSEKTVITGVLEPGETKTVTLYWRWVYDAAEVDRIVGGRRYTSATSAEFDAFDTKVGMNPDKYKADMTAQVLISGTQLEPGSVVYGQGSGEETEESGFELFGLMPYEGAEFFWYNEDSGYFICQCRQNFYSSVDGSNWDSLGEYSNPDDLPINAAGSSRIYLPLEEIWEFYYDSNLGYMMELTDWNWNYTTYQYDSESGSWIRYGSSEDPEDSEDE